MNFVSVVKLNESKNSGYFIFCDCLECSIYSEMNEILTNKLEVSEIENYKLVCILEILWSFQGTKEVWNSLHHNCI